MSAVGLFVQLSTATILVGAGVLKLAQPTSFDEFRLPRIELSRRGRHLASVLVSTVEVAVGLWVAVLGGGFAVGAAAALFAGFALVNWDAHRRGESESCQCLGAVLEMRHDWVAAAVDAAIAASLLIAAVSGERLSVRVGGERAAVALLIGLLGAIVYWLSLYARSVVIQPRVEARS